MPFSFWYILDLSDPSPAKKLPVFGGKKRRAVV
jgi:hypothetical protein